MKKILRLSWLALVACSQQPVSREPDETEAGRVDAGAEAEAGVADAASEAPSCGTMQTPCSAMSDCCAGSICPDAGYGAGYCSQVCRLPIDCTYSGCCIGTQDSSPGYCWEGCTH